MKESFRSTRPMTEFAFNVLQRLYPDEESGPDHKELIEMGLVERVERAGIPWWTSASPRSTVRAELSRSSPPSEDEYRAIGNQTHPMDPGTRA